MKKIIEAMKKAALFADIRERELPAALDFLAAQEKNYEKNTFLIHQGDKSKGVGLVVEGSVYIMRVGLEGDRELLTEVREGEIFGEVFAILPEKRQNVTVVAATDCRVIFFSIEQLLAAEGKMREIQKKIINNLLTVLAKKNLFLTSKISHLSQRSIREKVLSYLEEESLIQGSRKIEIPFDRQQLADYLAVDRSALSRELSNMQKEGYIQYHKRNFVLMESAHFPEV